MRIQNGPVTKRRTRKSVAKVSERGGRSRKKKDQRGRQGSNIFWMLMLTGAFVAAGFVFALRSQINVHQIGQAEAQLREELEEIASRQRFEILEQQRALSPSESDRKARASGLIQPRLNESLKMKKEAPRPVKKRY